MKTLLIPVLILIILSGTTEAQSLQDYSPSDFQIRITSMEPLHTNMRSGSPSPLHLLISSNSSMLNYRSEWNRNTLFPAMSASFMMSQSTGGDDLTREERCLRTGRILGTLSGSSMGVFALYLGIKGEDMEGPFWKTLAISIPSMLIGGYAGSRGTEWATRQIMKSNPKVAESALKGIAYGFVDGAITGVASMVPLLTLGYLLDVINFNEEIGILQVIGMSALGGGVFGGMIGAVAGAVYGPYVSLYMKY